MIAALKPYQIYSLLALAILANFYLVANESYFALAYPLALLVVVLSLFATDKVFLFIVFCTPLSINLENIRVLDAAFYFPTEPLLFGIMVLYIMRVLAGDGISQKFLRHPVTIATMIYIGWILLTSITSSLFMVSIKFFVVKLWFVASCYFFAKEIFADYSNIKRFLWLYIIPFAGVIIYTVIMHAQHNFEQDPAHWVMQPFFKDHTSYGAVLAMFFPVIFGLMFNPKYSGWMRAGVFAIALIFAAGIILSYTRAAWVSLAGAALVWLVMKLRIDFRLLVIVVGIAGGMLYLNFDRLVLELERNTQDSSDDFAEHVQSISNISSDASNLERLNRWNCALRMFEERPVFGFGPGTYQFQYARFQFESEKTIISTNMGDGGNAHSEYLGPLAESGLFGFLSFALLVGVVIYKGVRVYYRIEDPEMKIILMGVLLGLITYVTHGVLNNYLDTDKASVPFWGFMAMIVAIELYHLNGENKPTKKALFDPKSAAE